MLKMTKRIFLQSFYVLLSLLAFTGAVGFTGIARAVASRESKPGPKHHKKNYQHLTCSEQCFYYLTINVPVVLYITPKP